MVAQVSATLPATFGKSGFGQSPTGPSGNGNAAVDTISEFTSGSGITLNHVLVPSSAGITPIATQTVFHSGGSPPVAATSGTDVTSATTVTYVSEIYIPVNCTITGIAVLNGSANGGNIQVSLADSTGVPIAAALSASVTQTPTANYQQVPFAVAYAAKGPGRYFVLVQSNNTSNKLRCHPVGNFRAGSVTGGTYGTFTTVAAITGFTADLGPICSTY